MSSISDLREQIRRLTINNSRQQNQISGYKADISALREKFAEQDAQLAALTAELAASQKQLRAMKKQLEALRTTPSTDIDTLHAPRLATEHAQHVKTIKALSKALEATAVVEKALSKEKEQRQLDAETARGYQAFANAYFERLIGMVRRLDWEVRRLNREIRRLVVEWRGRRG